MKCLFTTLEYWRRARDRNMHFLPPDQPAYKKNFGKIGWLLLLVCNKVVWWAPFVCVLFVVKCTLIRNNPANC